MMDEKILQCSSCGSPLNCTDKNEKMLKCSFCGSITLLTETENNDSPEKKESRPPSPELLQTVKNYITNGEMEAAVIIYSNYCRITNKQARVEVDLLSRTKKRK